MAARGLRVTIGHGDRYRGTPSLLGLRRKEDGSDGLSLRQSGREPCDWRLARCGRLRCEEWAGVQLEWRRYAYRDRRKRRRLQSSADGGDAKGCTDDDLRFGQWPGIFGYGRDG